MATSSHSAIVHDVGISAILEIQLTEALKVLEEKSDSEEATKKVKEVIALVKSLNPYSVERSTLLSPQIDNIMKDTSTFNFTKLFKEGKFINEITDEEVRMISFPGHVQLMQFLVRLIKAKNILEVGTFTGFGACAMAEVMEAGGKVTGIEIEPVLCEFVNKRAQEHGLNVDVKEGKAIDILKSLAKEGQQFDFIYIDCVKNEYLQYYQIIMDNKMLSPNGLIVCDNVIWSGRSITRSDANGSALDDFAQFVVEDKRVVSVLLPCFDGTLLIQHDHDKS